MKEKIGFIGCGNMAQAMIGGLVESNLISNEMIIVSNPLDDQLDMVKKKYNVKTLKDNNKLVMDSDVVIIAVKPNVINEVLTQIKDGLDESKILISIAAGVSIKEIEEIVGFDRKIIRIMPNTPVLVGEGMSAICGNAFSNDKDLAIAEEIFSSFGKIQFIEEKLFDGVTAVSGSSPALIYILIEAMADAAVMSGLHRDKAYILASQAVLGSAKMVLETECHPGKLKDNVCSPAGTTIEMVAKLEEKGFRNSVISALNAAAEKSCLMTKK
ncbi:pyrroline-5-carboxylate reductase [Alkalibacter mobilis]|uniref:pyrroline-5-carboxylate reductase n=1 Tax=Alkalibacter mobilis TaxID=2787712 RepID=UPI00189F72A1|nr:pyrroline-5-carboxylate reductase [Alkalibacter mobilis]MBF7097041.1 pyrroline-5-carboxylate reductase [Alkalibacter mobilis]